MTMFSAPWACRLWLRRDAVEHDVGFGGRAYLLKLLGRQVRRAEHQPTRNAVKLQQRKRSAELLAHRQEHRSATKRLEFAAEYGAGREALKRNHAGSAVKGAWRRAA